MPEKMTRDEHTKRHVELHKAFDELVADYIAHGNGLPSKTTITELIKWSFQQTIDPAEA